MPVHTMQPGETVAGLAEIHGLFAAVIWDHPANGDLRARRRRIDALAPGDPLFIPEREPRTESLDTDRRHRFVRKGIPARIRLQLRSEGRPRAELAYVIEVAGQTVRGQTDTEGVLDAFVPASAREATLRLGGDDARPIRLRLGGMEPDNTLSGVRKRLANLGIPAPDGDDLTATAWRLALFRFQRLRGLEVTMKLDAATSQALLDGHDRVGRFEGSAP